MIIQTAPEGQPRFAIKMDEHTALAGQFARAFGNQKFERVDPYDLMLYLVTNHDKGWVGLDAAPKTDRRTGLPYNLADTPGPDLNKTSTASPDFIEEHHPYAGLLSSMHIWGLYNGRYGLSDLLIINTLSGEDRPHADRMLDAELERQARLTARLEGDPKAAAWLKDGRLQQNYRQLQLFDMLALYFNRAHEGARGEMKFKQVPVSKKSDLDVTIRPLSPGVYGMAPYPFAEDSGEFSFEGRYLQPRAGDADVDWAPAFATTRTERQHFRIVPT